MTFEEALNKAIEDHKIFDEEIKVRDSIYFLKEYCGKHNGCEGCYIKRKLLIAGEFHSCYCPLATVINCCQEYRRSESESEL